MFVSGVLFSCPYARPVAPGLLWGVRPTKWVDLEIVGFTCAVRRKFPVETCEMGDFVLKSE